QPFLFFDDPRGSKRLPVGRLLDNIEQTPALRDVPKLLLFDATQLTASWPRGVLRNDFVAELRTLLEQRRTAKKDRDLWVLCASAEGQKSWPAAVYGRTAFAHFVIEGLRGAADGVFDPNGRGRTGRVTLRELEVYVKRNVAEWARREHHALQDPVL